MLVQKDLGDKRAPWMESLQEYDIEIKPSSMVRGKFICKLATDSTHFPVYNIDVNINKYFLYKEIFLFSSLLDSWCSDMRILLET